MDATSEQDFNRGLYGNTCMSEYIFFSQELQSCLNVSRHMYQYLAKYNLLHAPSGFRSNHSCQTALVNIIDRWIEEMNNGNVNVVILLDLKKAFDVVDHDIMAKKLEIYGFNKKALALLIFIDRVHI